MLPSWMKRRAAAGAALGVVMLTLVPHAQAQQSGQSQPHCPQVCPPGQVPVCPPGTYYLPPSHQAQPWQPGTPSTVPPGDTVPMPSPTPTPTPDPTTPTPTPTPAPAPQTSLGQFASSGFQGASGFPSMIAAVPGGYIDNAIPRTRMTFRFDAG